MKPKPVLYRGGAGKTGLAEGGLGIDTARLAGSGTPEFTDVVLLDRGRRINTPAGSVGSDGT